MDVLFSYSWKDVLIACDLEGKVMYRRAFMMGYHNMACMYAWVHKSAFFALRGSKLDDCTIQYSVFKSTCVEVSKFLNL